MYIPGYELKSFETLSPQARMRVLGTIINALCVADMADIREMRAEGTPRPPSSSVRVLDAADQIEDSAAAIEAGAASCPAIIAWRVAELRDQGEDAHWVIQRNGGALNLRVRRTNGTLEDPCGLPQWNAGAQLLAMRSMWEPKIQLASFATTPADDKMSVICKMLDVLHEANESWLAEGGVAPPLVQSGVYYKEEKLGEDRWQDIPRTIFLGFGDCEDIASWRVSELRNAGEKAARHAVAHRKSPFVVLYHIEVFRADGSLEDPSCMLGMPGACKVVLGAAQAREVPHAGSVVHPGLLAQRAVQHAGGLIASNVIPFVRPEDVVAMAAGWR
jgi:hypothetical protein